MTLSHKQLEIFMTAWPVGGDLKFALGLADRGLLDPQIGYRDSWNNIDAAIDALLGRRVAGKVALAVD
jgi:NADPH2:quinone reductase